MSNISDKLIQLSNIKSDIKTAINNKGQSVGDDFSTYANAIDNITTGDGPVYQNPDFYEARTKGGTDYSYLFAYAPSTINIDYIANWDTSRVTSMKGTFSNCSSSIEGIENWDTSSVTDTSYMFDHFTNKSTYLDLSVLDFSNVSKVDYMFGYSNTDYFDVKNINLTGTTSYYNLFNSCSGTELDLSSWNIDNVTSLSYIFYFSKYKKIDLTGWNTVNVTNMSSMFYYASSLTTLLIPDWDMTNTTNTSSMFSSTSKLQYIDASRCNNTTMNKLASLIPAKTQAAYGEIIVPADTSQAAIDALTAKYWEPILSKPETDRELALELDEIKPGKTTKVWTNNNNPLYGDGSLETIEFISSDESVATVNGREITGVAEGTVEISARNKETQEIISTVPITLTVSNTDSKPNLVKFRTNGLESDNGEIIYINGDYITKSRLTYDDIANIYSYDPGEQIIGISFNFDVNTSSGNHVNEIVKFNFNAANILYMNETFGRYQGTILDLSDWDTGNVLSMNSTFYRSPNLIEIKGVLDLSNVTDVSRIFTSCSNLETVYLKNIYKNSTITNNSKLSINLGSTKVKDESLIYIINELPNLYDKGITNNTQIKLTLPPSNTLTDEQKQVARDKNWIVVN